MIAITTNMTIAMTIVLIIGAVDIRIRARLIESRLGMFMMIAIMIDRRVGRSLGGVDIRTIGIRCLGRLGIRGIMMRGILGRLKGGAIGNLNVRINPIMIMTIGMGMNGDRSEDVFGVGGTRGLVFGRRVDALLRVTHPTYDSVDSVDSIGSVGWVGWGGVFLDFKLCKTFGIIMKSLGSIAMSNLMK
jgi:hypothetical protein